MRYSQLLGKTTKTVPADAETVNARLLTQAGFVDQLMAGVYSYLPLGLRVLKHIQQIVREEINRIGGQELLMPMLHPSEIWKTTGAWESVDVLFKINSRTDKEYALGQSEEEVVAPLVMSRAISYKDLPVAVYQINWKFRDELRAKSGIMRGREFLMKDMYSFHESEADFAKFYEVVKQAYLAIFQRLGLVAKVTEGSGGVFSKKISYEFMVLTDAGEDDILYCEACNFCVNVEIATVKKGDRCAVCRKGTLQADRASEVGNVFDLGQKYGRDFNLSFTAANGSRQYPVMGCYGIGITRVMGVVVEKFHDDKGIIWPKAVAPYQVHLVSLGNGETVLREAEKIYGMLQKKGIEVLWDDRNESAGVKLADADLIGIPLRMVVSKKTIEKEALEVKARSERDASMMSLDEAVDVMKA